MFPLVSKFQHENWRNWRIHLFFYYLNCTFSTVFSALWPLYSCIVLLTILRHFNQRGMTQSLFLWLKCVFPPTVSLYLAEVPACEQAAANLLQEKNKKSIWCLDLKGSNLWILCQVMRISTTWRHFSDFVKLFHIFKKYILDLILYAFSNFYYFFVFLETYAPDFFISIHSVIHPLLWHCFQTELNKHSAILLFAWPWNQTPSGYTTAFRVTHLFHYNSSSPPKGVWICGVKFTGINPVTHVKPNLQYANVEMNENLKTGRD